MATDFSADLESSLRGMDAAAANGISWKVYKSQLTSEVENLLRSAGKQVTDKDALLRVLRRVHNILYVADRIRRDAIRDRRKLPTSLVARAELVLDMPHCGSPRTAERRTPLEERYAISARVNWHKLLKAEGFEAIQSPNTNVAGQSRNLTSVVARLSSGQTPNGGRLLPAHLRRYIEQNVSELLAAVETSAASFEEEPREFGSMRRALATCLVSLRSV